MADYGSYDSGIGDVISAIQRPALDIPTEQARIRQNLALQDQQAALQSQFTPYQQASDLVNHAIVARQNIEARRNQLSQQLGSTINRREAAGIASQIEGLDQAAHGLMQDAALQSRLRMDEADQRRMLMHQDAVLAERALKTDRSAAIDEEGSALMIGLGRLDSLRRNGYVSDEQHDAHLLDLGQKYGLGLRHPEAGKMFTHFVEESDRRNQYNLRRTASEAARVGARYGIDVQVGEDGLPSIEATKIAALQTPKGKAEAVKVMNDELQARFGIVGGVGSLFNPVQPHTSDDKESINLPFLDKTGKIGTQKVPMQLFNQAKADFNDRYFSLFPPVETFTGNAVQTQQQAAGGLQVGAQRNVGGINYTWNGTRWEQK